MSTPLAINGQRLEQALHELRSHGALGERGVSALALTPENIDARIDIIERMERLRLTVRIDPLGNIYGFRPDRDGNLDGPAVYSGSHDDTVHTGGMYDGRLGILGVLEAFESMDEAGIETDFPLICVAFTAEEGVRFKAMTGSAYACGLMSEEEALDHPSLLPGETVRLRDVLEDFRAALRRAHAEGRLRHDYSRWERVDMSMARAFVELHIEQGPTLEDRHLSVAPVEAVLGISQRNLMLEGGNVAPGRDVLAAELDIAENTRATATAIDGDPRGTVGAAAGEGAVWLPPVEGETALRVTVRGVSAHAGGGVMYKRNDALVGAAALVTAARREGARQNPPVGIAVGDLVVGAEDTRSGEVKGLVNVVPDTVRFTLGIRGSGAEAVRAALDACAADLREPQGASRPGGESPGEGVTVAMAETAPLRSVPSRGRMTVDQRNVTEDLIDEADRRLDKHLEQWSGWGLRIASERRQRIAPSPFNQAVQDIIFEAQRNLGYPATAKAVLAAGHDSNNFAYIDPAINPLFHRRVPCAMIAVACDDGLSHNIHENVQLRDLERGGNVLAETLRILADARTVLPEWIDMPPRRHKQTGTSYFVR